MHFYLKGNPYAVFTVCSRTIKMCLLPMMVKKLCTSYLRMGIQKKFVDGLEHTELFGLTVSYKNKVLENSLRYLFNLNIPRSIHVLYWRKKIKKKMVIKNKFHDLIFCLVSKRVITRFIEIPTLSCEREKYWYRFVILMLDVLYHAHESRMIKITKYHLQEILFFKYLC